MGTIQPRLDHNIGTQECLAVILGLYTWLEDLEGAVVTIYTDNEGVRYSLLSVTSKLPEVALSVARFWHVVSDVQIGVLIRGVESKANVADGPTRDVLNILQKLGAIEVRPVLPRWILDLWRYTGLADDLTAVACV